MDVRLRNEIKKVEGKLVTEAVQLLDNYNPTSFGNEFGKSQLKNLQNIANQTEAIEVITNFIRYQMGRERNSGWNQADSHGTRFGESFIARIEKTIPERILTLIKGEIDDSQKQSIQIELTRRFIGYACRQFTYLRGAN
ncbi:MAG: hypothetical protein K1Y36_28180 [Blastocatellia bacterium]|nr:hypothetical protein [Blastocatellia bacterium]